MEKQTFEGLEIKPEIMEILRKLGFNAPTPIQYQAIPVAIKGNDIIGIAQTGTGKTLAFGVPTIQRILSSQGSALIILPTRELAMQVNDSLSRIARNFNLKSTVLIGGQNIDRQIRDLKADPHIIISTPGRLIDHLERKTVKLNKVKMLVLDEADRMLDMGFAPQVKRILQEVPENRQTMLFSATMPVEIISLANRYMKTPLRVEVAPAGSATENVTHEIFFVKDSSKLALLESILKGKNGSILIFSRTKHGAKRIAFAIRKMGYTSTEIHSNRTLSQRMNALDGFKKGKYQVMVATDIAARGIDVKGIELVINYDLPDAPEDYVHRIGRTGRADNLGHAISFATPRQARDVRMIEKLIKKELPVSKLPELAELDKSITQELSKRDKERNYSREDNNHSRRSEHREYGASKIRFGKISSSSEKSGNGKYKQDSNPKRGFLPKRSSDSRSHYNESASPAQRGKEFYKDFNDGNSSKSLQQKSHRSFEQKPQGFNERKAKGYFESKSHGKFKGIRNDHSLPKTSSPDRNRSNNYQEEPFMNSEIKPDYRKPFGSYKSAKRGKGGNRTPFNKGPRKTSVRATR